MLMKDTKCICTEGSLLEPNKFWYFFLTFFFSFDSYYNSELLQVKWKILKEKIKTLYQIMLHRLFSQNAILHLELLDLQIWLIIIGLNDKLYEIKELLTQVGSKMLVQKWQKLHQFSPHIFTGELKQLYQRII